MSASWMLSALLLQTATSADAKAVVDAEAAPVAPVAVADADLRVVPGDTLVRRVDLSPSAAFIAQYNAGAYRRTLLGQIIAGAGVTLLGVGLYVNDQGAASVLQQEIIGFNSGERSDAAARAGLEGRRSDLQTRGYLWSGMVVVGVVAAFAGGYSWLTAPDPDRYADFRAPTR